MSRRHQSVLAVVDDPEEPLGNVAPSVFRPGQTPYRFRSDPRATSEWRRLRKAVLARDGHRCRRCGRPASEVDHRVELADGGAAYEPENLQALCAGCHDSKSSELRYRRSRRAAVSWGRLALCPKCSGSGTCPICLKSVHPCGSCLGIRFVPEVSADASEIPGQILLAQVSRLAWAGAEPSPD